MFKTFKRLFFVNLFLVFSNVPLVLLYLYVKLGTDPDSVAARRTEQFESEVLSAIKQYISLLLNSIDPTVLLVSQGILILITGWSAYFVIKKFIFKFIPNMGMKKRL